MSRCRANGLYLTHLVEEWNAHTSSSFDYKLERHEMSFYV